MRVWGDVTLHTPLLFPFFQFIFFLLSPTLSREQHSVAQLVLFGWLGCSFLDCCLRSVLFCSVLPPSLPSTCTESSLLVPCRPALPSGRVLCYNALSSAECWVDPSNRHYLALPFPSCLPISNVIEYGMIWSNRPYHTVPCLTRPDMSMSVLNHRQTANAGGLDF